MGRVGRLKMWRKEGQEARSEGHQEEIAVERETGYKQHAEKRAPVQITRRRKASTW